MPLRYIPALIIFTSLTASSIFFFKKDFEYLAGMKRTEGVVIRFGAKSVSTTTSGGSSASRNTQPIIRFNVEGESYLAEGRAMGIPRWEMGQASGVYYDPENPKKNRIDRFDEKFFYALICLFFLSGGLLFSLVNFTYYKKTGKVLS